MSNIRKFVVGRKNDHGGFCPVGTAEYHAEGAGFCSGIKPEHDWAAVEKAVCWIVSQPACCGVTLDNGLKIQEV